MIKLRQHPIGTRVNTGQICPESGVWQVANAFETAPIAEGNRIPPYKGQAVTWILIQYA